jgi:hypothetical protein
MMKTKRIDPARVDAALNKALDAIERKVSDLENTQRGLVHSWTPGGGFIVGVDGQTYSCGLNALDGLGVSSLQLAAQVEFIGGQNTRNDNVVVRVTRILV